MILNINIFSKSEILIFWPNSAKSLKQREGGGAKKGEKWQIQTVYLVNDKCSNVRSKENRTKSKERKKEWK